MHSYKRVANIFYAKIMLNLKFLSIHNISSESNKFVCYITYEKGTVFRVFFFFLFVCLFYLFFVCSFCFCFSFFVDYHFHF